MPLAVATRSPLFPRSCPTVETEPSGEGEARLALPDDPEPGKNRRVGIRHVGIRTIVR